MAKDQPGVAGVVVAFQARPHLAVYLTAVDRMDVNRWRDPARAAGFDRMVIYEREVGDDAEIGDFLCLHARGQPWSSWGFARKGSVIGVWCCLTGMDFGEFPSMSAALSAVLSGSATAPAPEPTLAVITDLMPHLRQTARRFGSAA